MGINPVSELKRRLEDESTPLAKRLCLARNVTATQYLPTSVKERAIIDWLNSVDVNTEIVESLLSWQLDESGGELLGKIIKVLANYVEKFKETARLAEKIVTLLENEKIISIITSQLDDYLVIFRTLLMGIQMSENVDRIPLSVRFLENVKKVYKNVTKKVDFVAKFLEGPNLEVVFYLLNHNEFRLSSLSVCETILFPAVKKAHFSVFLQALIREESIDRLLEEKGDNVKSVLKIMTSFFAFPKDRTSADVNFLINFINAFVTSFKNDSHLIFMFFIVAVNALGITQTYLNPAAAMPTIAFGQSDKVKRLIILQSLECLKENEIDLNVKLTETLGEKLTKVEIKKNFVSFLQATVMSVLKVEGKPDKTTLKLISTALKLDPTLIEPKLDIILPNMMISKKTANILEDYIEMLNTLLDILFKLSRGPEFISRMLPLLKTKLEALNTEQFQLVEQLQDAIESGSCCEEVKDKIITGEDLFPSECVEKYGKLTSDLMLRQNGELFVNLQKEFESQCLVLLEEGYVSPSLVTLSQVLSAILSKFLAYNKMADHTVPAHIATEFWSNFKLFQDNFLAKFGRCLLNLSYNRFLTLSFLNLCRGYLNLKVIHIRYSNVPAAIDKNTVDKSTEVWDFSSVLPCLDSAEWLKLSKMVEANRDECVDILNYMMLQKIMFCNLSGSEEMNDYGQRIKTHLISVINQIWGLIDASSCNADLLFSNLDSVQERKVAKALICKLETDYDDSLLNCLATSTHKTLVITVAMETLKIILTVIEDEEFLSVHKSLRKAIKAGFEFEEVVKGSNGPAIFDQLSKSISLTAEGNQDKLAHYLKILKILQVSALDENTQLLSVFILLAIKNILADAKVKKLKKAIDDLLLDIFEMAVKNPNLLKIFPIEYIFAFDNSFLQTITLTRNKTSNRWIILKATLETAVKKVKTDSDVVKNIVQILLSNKNKTKDLNFFNDQSNQITCMILPIIAKEKKAITTSQYRSILADLQEKLHKFLLKSFKKINFDAGNQDEDGKLATLNSIEAYALTLSKYCESNNEEDSSNLDDIATSLDYFLSSAITAIKDAETKWQHYESSIQLLNVTLRHMRKLEAKDLFKERDKTLQDIWQALKIRLSMVLRDGGTRSMDETAVTIRLLSELCSVEMFAKTVSSDLSVLFALKAPNAILKEPSAQMTSHKMAKYLLSSILKANIVGPKSAAIAKSVLRSLRNLLSWLRTHFDKRRIDADWTEETDAPIDKMAVDDNICEIVACDVEAVTEVIVNAKKLSLSYRFMDAIFELNQSVRRLLSHELSAVSFARLVNSSLGSLNALPLHRSELLEDRWPCYLQCYRGVVSCLSTRASSQHELDRASEEALAEAAHSLEKLTQAICKHKTQVSRLAAYLVADLCCALERSTPARHTRQHLESCALLLVQAADGAHAAAFLRRALAGAAGHATLTYLYTVYKRYHKYVGTS